MTTKKNRIISIIIILISLPLSIATATNGGGMTGYFFAAILAIGVDMFMGSFEKNKVKNLI